MKAKVRGDLLWDFVEESRSADHDARKCKVSEGHCRFLRKLLHHGAVVDGHDSTLCRVVNLTDTQCGYYLLPPVESEHLFESYIRQNIAVEDPKVAVGTNPLAVRAKCSRAAEQSIFIT